MTLSSIGLKDIAMQGPLKPATADRWVGGRNALPPADSSLLAAYNPSRPGFEFLNAPICEGGPDVGCFSVEGNTLIVCLWDIWVRGKDPADSDPEARTLNDLQRSLGPLSDDARYVRLQTACFERCYHTFPGNIDLILRGIGAGAVDVSEPVSCEPPWAWFRRILAQSKPVSHINESRRGDLRRYLLASQAWMFAGDPDALPADTVDTGWRVYGLLGPPTRLKRLYVDMLIVSLLFWTTPSALDHGSRWRVLTEHLEFLAAAVRTELAGQVDAIGPLIHRINDGGSCHHAFLRRLQHIFAHIGAGQSVEFPDKGSERRRIQETVTNYIHALGCWLNMVDTDAATAAWPASAATIDHVGELLGVRTPLKCWLTACLHKKLRENQARHGRGAIDSDADRFQMSLNILPLL